MKTELCLRALAGDRVVGSVVLPGRFTLADAVDTPQARTLVTSHVPHHARPFVAADHGCYWSLQDCR